MKWIATSALTILCFLVVAEWSDGRKDAKTEKPHVDQAGLIQVTRPRDLAPTPEKPFDAVAHNLLANRLAAEYLRADGGADRPLPSFFGDLNARLHRTDTDNLMRTAASNVAALDAKFKDKHLLVTGPVMGVRQSPTGKGYMIDLPGGFAIFEGDDKFVSTLTHGVMVRFSCRYSPGLASSGYGLDGCVSIESLAEQMGQMLALSKDRQPEAIKTQLDKLLREAMRASADLPQFCGSKVDVINCGLPMMPPDPPSKSDADPPYPAPEAQPEADRQ